LESLAVYFDTDSQSMAGLPLSAAKEKFIAMVRMILSAAPSDLTSWLDITKGSAVVPSIHPQPCIG
jgi:hypothetical protein